MEAPKNWVLACNIFPRTLGNSKLMPIVQCLTYYFCHAWALQIFSNFLGQIGSRNTCIICNHIKKTSTIIFTFGDRHHQPGRAFLVWLEQNTSLRGVLPRSTLRPVKIITPRNRTRGGRRRVGWPGWGERARRGAARGPAAPARQHPARSAGDYDKNDSLAATSTRDLYLQP